MPPAIPFIGLAIAAASAGFAVKSSLDQKAAAKKQAKAAKESARIQQVRADVAARRARKKQLRATRLRRAQIIQQGINSGAGLDSSTTVSAAGGVNTQFGANIGAINESQGFARQIGTQESEINRQSGKIAQSQANNQIVQSIGNVGSSIFDRSGGFTTIFGGNKAVST